MDAKQRQAIVAKAWRKVVDYQQRAAELSCTEEEPPQCNGPFGDEEACPVHGTEIRAGRGRGRKELHDLAELELLYAIVQLLADY